MKKKYIIIYKTKPGVKYYRGFTTEPKTYEEVVESIRQNRSPEYYSELEIDKIYEVKEMKIEDFEKKVGK